MVFKVKNISIIKALFVWCFFCSIVLALVYNITDTKINLLFVKDLVILIFLVIVFNLALKVNRFSFFSILFFSYLFVSSIFSDAPLMAKAASIRQMVIPFVLVFIGVFLGKGTNLIKAKRVALKIGFVVLILGIFELALSIWHHINITGYFDVKNIPVYNLSYKNLYYYPVFFIEPILGGLKRMTSTMLDPINLGHTFAFLLSMVFFEDGIIKKQVNKYWLAFLFSISLILTFSKGAILQVIIIVLLMNSKLSRGIKVLIILVLSLILVYFSKFHAGVLKHLEGLISAISNLNLFGHGLGKTGNQAFMFGEPTIKIGDTFFGAIIGQLGLMGYILWILPFYYIIKCLNVNLVSKIFIAQIFISLISENSFNLLSIFLVCIFIGMEYKQKLSISNA